MKIKSSGFEYDVFISYSHRDGDWVWDWLVPRLKQEGLRICIDRECFEAGEPIVVAIERAVKTSRKTLLVLTPDYVASEWAESENLLVQTSDPAARRRRMIPLKLKECDLPERIKMLNYVDFTDPNRWGTEFQRLLTAIGPPLDAEGISPRRTEDIWSKLGLLRNPFGALDAEDEPRFLLDWCLRPQYFREIWDSELRMCLLVGENGTGKTTVRKWIEAECSAAGSRLAVPYSVADLTDVVALSQDEAGRFDVERLRKCHSDKILRLAVVALFKRLQSKPGLIGVLPEEQVDELKWFAQNYAPELLSEGQINERLKRKGVDLHEVSARKLEEARQNGTLDGVMKEVKVKEEESKKAVSLEVALVGADDKRITRETTSLPVLLEHFCRLAGFLGIASVHVLVDSLDKVAGIKTAVEKQVALIEPLLTDVYLIGVQGVQFPFFVTPELETAIYSIPKINKDRLHVTRIWQWPEEKLFELLDDRIRAYKISQESPVDDFNQLLSNLDLGGWQTRLMDMLKERAYTPREMLRLASCIVNERIEGDLNHPEDPKSDFRERVLQRFETLGGIPSHALQLEPHRGGAIIDFVQRWVVAMQESEYGLDLDESKVLPLAQKYVELTDKLLDYYCDPRREQCSDLMLSLTNEVFTDAEGFLNQEYDAVFLVVVDALSLVDWMVIRDSIRSDLMERSTVSLRTEDLRLAVIPTLTPVATSCLYSGHLPAELGVFGWKYVNADKRQTDLSIPEENKQARKGGAKDSAVAIGEDFEGMDTGRAFTLIAKASWSARQDAYLTGLYRKLCSGIQFARMRKNKPAEILNEVRETLLNEDFKTRVVAVYLDDFDKYAHFQMELPGDERRYYSAESDIIRDYVVNPLVLRANGKRERYAMILTADHGKFTRYERDVVEKVIGAFGWNSSAKARIASGLDQCSSSIVRAVEPEITAKTYIHWIRRDDESQVRRFLQGVVGDSQDLLFYIGEEEVSKILPGKPRSNILMPNVVLISKYNFTATSWSSHGGVSLSEMLVPLVQFDINGRL